jgi:hypothetical protein
VHAQQRRKPGHIIIVMGIIVLVITIIIGILRMNIRGMALILPHAHVPGAAGSCAGKSEATLVRRSIWLGHGRTMEATRADPRLVRSLSGLITWAGL